LISGTLLSIISTFAFIQPITRDNNKQQQQIFL